MEIWDGAMLSLGQLFTRNSMVASDLGEKAMVKSKFALFFNNTVIIVCEFLARMKMRNGNLV